MRERDGVTYHVFEKQNDKLEIFSREMREVLKNLESSEGRYGTKTHSSLTLPTVTQTNQQYLAALPTEPFGENALILYFRRKYSWDPSTSHRQ